MKQKKRGKKCLVHRQKHFEYDDCPFTYITREYPAQWSRGDEAYYPVRDYENELLYEKYYAMGLIEKNVVFGGRLGEYRYYDMDKVIRRGLDLAESELID